MEIVIDSSVLVGLLAPRDRWHEKSTALWQAMQKHGHVGLYFDCVISESVSVAVRRLYEKKRAGEVENLLNRLETTFTADSITWIYPDVPRLYPEIIALMEKSGGELNFHDALIALSCQERGISSIASFDADFDQLSWLHRLVNPEDVADLQ